MLLVFIIYPPLSKLMQQGALVERSKLAKGNIQLLLQAEFVLYNLIGQLVMNTNNIC